MPRLPITWLAIAIAAAAAPAAHAEIGGTYKSALGKVKISEDNGAIVGKLVGKSPCGFKRGTVVLKGDRLDDSVTGEVKTCKVGKGCKGSVNGLAMLLITRSGSVISGYVHAESGSCKTPLKNSAVAFKRNNGRATGKSGADAEASGGNAGGGDSGDTNAAGTRTADNSTADNSTADNSTAASDDKRGRKNRRSRKARRGRRGGDNGSSSSASASNNSNSTSSADGSSAGSSAGSSSSGSRTSGSSSSGKVTSSKRASLDEGAPPVSPGRKARARAETLASDGMRLLGEPAKARRKFEEAVEVDPAYAEGWLGIGVTDYLNDRYEDAEDNYKRALEADPAIPDAYYNLACLYALQNDKEKAFNYLRIAVLNGFVDIHKVDQDPDLNNLHDDERYAKFKAGQIW